MEETGKKFYKQARLAFQRLSPDPGDIICVTYPKDMSQIQISSTQDFVEKLHKEFGVTVIMLSEGISMSALKEEDMNKLGWFKGKLNTNLH